jgi:hypothetical protein
LFSEPETKRKGPLSFAGGCGEDGGDEGCADGDAVAVGDDALPPQPDSTRAKRVERMA